MPPQLLIGGRYFYRGLILFRALTGGLFIPGLIFFVDGGIKIFIKGEKNKMECYDFTNPKVKENEAKAEMRAAMIKELYSYFSEKYGKENVSIVGKNELSVAYRTIKDKDGFLQEADINLTPMIKSWEDNGRFNKYDRLSEEEEYSSELELKDN